MSRRSLYKLPDELRVIIIIIIIIIIRTRSDFEKHLTINNNNNNKVFIHQEIKIHIFCYK